MKANPPILGSANHRHLTSTPLRKQQKLGDSLRIDEMDRQSNLWDVLHILEH